MEQESTVNTEALTDFSQKAEEIIGQVALSVDLTVGSFVMIIVGIIAIYLIHKIAAKFLFPHLHEGRLRLIKVAGVTVYALILVATASLVLNSVGVDATAFSHIALVIIFVVTVLIFFLLPFLPELPLKIGHLVEIRGELGTVTAISPLFTSLLKDDGTLVLIPNALIMSIIIKNYSRVSSTRIEIKLSVQNDIDLDRTKQILVKLMSEDERVLDEPSRPAVFLTKANAVSVDLFAVRWVKNEDWISTQSDLWEEIVNTSNEDILLAKPFLEY